MELFQTVSHPFPATSLCNKPGHHLWAWAESQTREEGSDSWGSLGQVKESVHLSETLLVPSQVLSHRASCVSSNLLSLWAWKPPERKIRGSVCKPSVPLCKVKEIGGAEVGLDLCFALSQVKVTTQGAFPQKVRGSPPSMGPVSLTDYPLESLQAETLKGANYQWM